jgi:tetratricopeptide (TPR) repeat protein
MFTNALRAKELFNESLNLARAAEDPAGAALACWGLGWLGLHTGDIAAMQRWLSESRRIYIALDDVWGRGITCMFLGVATDALGDREAAEAINREAVEAFEKCGDRMGLGWALVHCGEIPRSHGDNQRATEFYERGLTLCREVGNRTGTAYALTNLGMTLTSLGEFLRAEAYMRECLALTEGEMVLTAALGPLCLLGFAGVALARGDLRRAARLLGASLKAQEAVGGHYQPVDQRYYEQLFERLKSLMDQGTMMTEWKVGESLSLSEAIAFGRDLTPLD